MRKFLITVFFVVTILFFVIFERSNDQIITLKFLELEFIKPVPISLLILIPFLAGFVLGSMMNLLDRISLKREMKRLKKDLSDKNARLLQKESQPAPAAAIPDSQRSSDRL